MEKLHALSAFNIMSLLQGKSPMTIPQALAAVAVPYPPLQGGVGVLGCERWVLSSTEREVCWRLEGGNAGPYLGVAEGQLQDAQGQPGWQWDEEHHAGADYRGKRLTVRLCSQPHSCTCRDLSAACAHVFVVFSPA